MAVKKVENTTLWLDSLYEEFKYNAEAIAAEVHRVSSPVEVSDFIRNILFELNVRSIVLADSPLLKAINFEQIINPNTSVHFEELREKAALAELGISELDLAIAETGTLVQDASNINKRLVSTLPAVHLALVRTKCLVPTFLEALDLINKKLHNMSEYIAFISGPSRTADIERVLTIGVHGPGRLIILFVD